MYRVSTDLGILNKINILKQGALGKYSETGGKKSFKLSNEETVGYFSAKKLVKFLILLHFGLFW